MINLKIEKKDLWLLTAIMVFLVGVAYVIAYGGNQPAVMGHTPDEILGVCKSDGTGCPASIVNNFGSPTNKDSANNTLVKDTIYNATSDGFVLAMVLSTGSEDILYGYTDPNNPPTTLVIVGKTSVSGPNGYGGITMPVRKGDYWRVTHPAAVTIRWLPIGSGQCVRQ